MAHQIGDYTHIKGLTQAQEESLRQLAGRYEVNGARLQIIFKPATIYSGASALGWKLQVGDDIPDFDK